MSRRIYKKALLRAVEAFLEGSPSALKRAHRIIQHFYHAINRSPQHLSIDYIVWSFFFSALTDSVFYENRRFLQETRKELLGQTPHGISSAAVFHEDYRPSFTAEETEWYTQLQSMLAFLVDIPFARIHAATDQARQAKESWETMQGYIPEVALAEKLEEEYKQRNVLINEAAAQRPSPRHIGDETIYHLVLREITELLTALRLDKPAVYFGYPIFDGSYTSYRPYIPRRDTSPSPHDVVDMTQKVARAQTLLEALEGKRELFLSWHLHPGQASDNDVLIVSLS